MGVHVLATAAPPSTPTTSASSRPDGTYGMALNFQTHDEDWDSSQELWEQLKTAFKVPN